MFRIKRVYTVLPVLCNGDKDVLLRTRGLNLLTVMILIIANVIRVIPLFWWIKTKTWFWRDLTLLNELVLGLDDKLNDQTLQMQKDVAQQAAYQELIDATIKEIKSGNSDYGYGVGKPFRLDLGKLGKPRIRSPKDRPDQKWKEALQPHFYDKHAKKGVRERLGMTGSFPGAKRTAIVPGEVGEMAALRFGEDFDGVDSYNPQQPHNPHDPNGPFSKKKLKEKNETDESHKRRQQAIKDGKFNPDAWDFHQL